MRRILIVALGTALLIGCGGTSDISSTTVTPEGVLHLGGTIYTESEFRLVIRQDIAAGRFTEGFCHSLRGLSDDDVFMVIAGKSQISLPVTEQLRGAALIREECAKVFK